MKIQVHSEARVTIIELSGRVTGGRQATMFHGIVQEHLSRGGNNFVVDLQNVDLVNSVGLGMLVGAHNAISRSSGRLALANVTNIRSLLSMTRLITVLDTYDSRRDAVHAVGGFAA